MAKFYQVGGSVRDELLGIPSKDIDYAVEAESYAAMRQAILDRGGQIFKEDEKFLTIRAKVPELGATDYVLCRKDGSYSDGRRPDSVEVGTILDDLARRDFTVNAIAKAEDGTVIDPFGGISDIQLRLIRCVGNPSARFAEDRLRILRAIRFAITKNFAIEDNTRLAMMMAGDVKGVSVERIREELLKCFEKSTIQTIDALLEFPRLYYSIFDNSDLMLKPTIHVQQQPKSPAGFGKHKLAGILRRREQERGLTSV